MLRGNAQRFLSRWIKLAFLSIVRRGAVQSFVIEGCAAFWLTTAGLTD